MAVAPYRKVENRTELCPSHRSVRLLEGWGGGRFDAGTREASHRCVVCLPPPAASRGGQLSDEMLDDEVACLALREAWDGSSRRGPPLLLEAPSCGCGWLAGEAAACVCGAAPSASGWCTGKSPCALQCYLRCRGCGTMMRGEERGTVWVAVHALQLMMMVVVVVWISRSLQDNPPLCVWRASEWTRRLRNPQHTCVVPASGPCACIPIHHICRTECWIVTLAWVLWERCVGRESSG